MTLALVLVTCLQARAQDRVFVGAREVGAIGHFAEALGPAPAWLRYPRFGGDRYVHLPSGVVDLRTGAAIRLGDGYPVAYDRARPRVYLARENGIWQEDVTIGWSVLILPVPLNGLAGCIHATSADTLLCAFARPDGQHDILRPGPRGPELVATTRFADPFTLDWVVAPDGTRLYFAHCSAVWGTSPPFSCRARDIAMVELASGRETTAPVTDFPSPGLVWDEVHDRLFVIGYQRIAVFAGDLRPIGTATTGGRCRELAISPHTRRIYLNVYDYYYSAASATLSAYDAASFRLLEPGRTRTTDVACGPVAVLTAPGAPRHVRAVVSGRTVHLAWTNIGAASHFVLDVGRAPGRTDLTMFTGTEPRASFAGVPPGTYYIRLRGGNQHGGSRPSDEIAVTVR